MGLNLVGKIELDGAGFERGLHRAGEHAREFTTDFVKNAAISAFGFYGVEEAIKKTVETASELVNTSKRLDVTVEQLQILRQEAKNTGTDLGTVASAFEKIDEARAKALGGDKGAMKAFAALGVSPAQLQNSTAANIFTGPLSSAARSRSVEDIGPDLKEIIGRGFGELIPMLKEDTEELGAKMEGLGEIMDTEMAVKLNALDDEFSLISNVLTVQLGPAIIQCAQWILQLVGKVKELGSFLGGLSSHGIVKAYAALDKSVGESITSFLPDILAKKINSMREKLDSAAGLDPKELDDILTQAGEEAQKTAKENSDSAAALQAKFAKIVEELNNPKPRIVPVENSVSASGKKFSGGASQADALVRVGNFLGSNGNTLNYVDQQKVQLMQKQLKKLDEIKTVIGKANFGYGMAGVPL